MSLLSSNKELQKIMPEGALPLFLIQIVSTLGFSVLYSTLVLYIKGKLGLPASSANSIMGVFIALNYALHLLGGFWGGRLFSYRSLFCLGMVGQIIGCLLLSSANPEFLNYGLAAFLTGAGVNVTCINCMVTQLFSPEDKRRETAFLWNYAGMNIGFFVGFSMSGYFQLTQNYHTLFLLSSLGNVLSLLICWYNWPKLADRNTIYSKKSNAQKQQVFILGMGALLSTPFILCQILHYAQWASKLVLVVGIAMMALILFIAKQQTSKESRDKIVAFAVLMIVATVFWMLYQISPMGLTLFIENNVLRNQFDFIIPPQWFQNINTISIVFGGPLLAALFQKLRNAGYPINIPTQFAMALLFIGIAFVLLPIGIACANSQGMVNPNWIVASYLLQSFGELLISPIGYAMIGALAPLSLQGVMMGIWMLNSGVGATLSSYSSNLMIVGQDTSSALATNAGYSQVFLILGLCGIATSFVVFLLVPKLRALIHEPNVVVREKTNAPLTERVAV